MPTRKWYTDYPLYPSEYGKIAPIREIDVIGYDGDKYCRVVHEGTEFEIKSGYIYPRPMRFYCRKICKSFSKLLNRLEKEYYNE